MAYIGVPLLLLGAVGVYGFYKQMKNNPTPPTDGGDANATTSGNPANKGGPLEVVVASGEKPITNPSVNTTALIPKLPGQVRLDLEKGQRPFNALPDHRPAFRPRMGYDLYPADGYVASSGATYHPSTLSASSAPPKATQTRPSPETASIGMPFLQVPLSNVVNAARTMGSAPKAQTTSFLNAINTRTTIQNDTIGAVPRDYRKISGYAGLEPPEAGDIWDSKRTHFRPANVVTRNATGRSDRRWSANPAISPAAGTTQLHVAGKVVKK